MLRVLVQHHNIGLVLVYGIVGGKLAFSLTRSRLRSGSMQWSIRTITDAIKIWPTSFFVRCTSCLEQSATDAATDLKYCFV